MEYGRLLIAAALWSALGVMTEAEAQPSPQSVAQAQPAEFSIPPQPLMDALVLFGRQSGLQVSVDAALIRGIRSPGVTGPLSPEQALARLLAGTGITYRMTGGRTALLEPVPPVPDGGPESGPLLLDRLTVTARRTEELLQDVPNSVFVLPAEALQRSNVTDLEDFALRTPNLIITETGSRISTNIAIRGISNLTIGRSSAPTVGVYIDEVMLNPTGTNTGIDPNLFDLERAEVAYGPQGTSFGRGTIGGAINYVTRRPTADFEASLEGEVGSFPDGLGRLIVNGSLTGDRRLMGRLVAFGRYDDGFVALPNAGGSADNQDYGTRLSLRSQPTGRLTLDLSGSFDRTVFRANNYATIDSIAGDGDLEFLINDAAENRVDRSLVSLRGEYDFDAGTLISNTSVLHIEAENDQDFDFTELDLLLGTSNFRERSISQEFRFEAEPFTLPAIGETRFITGINGTWAQEERESLLIAGADGLLLGVPPGTRNPNPLSTEEVTDLGVFGEVRVRPLERLELAIGGRFTFNEIEFTEEGLGSIRETFTAVTPRASVLYDWTDAISTYATVSTGFKSGGFNNLGTGDLSGRAFDNETAINYEGGIRSRWLDDRLFVSASGFALFYEDIQVSSLVGGIDSGLGRIIQNAAEARSVGAELQIAAQPVDGLRLDLAYGFTDAEFTDFTTAPGGDATGLALPNAPKHTLSLIGEYTHPVLDAFADAFIRAEYSYTSDFTSTADVDARVFDAYDVVNLRAGLRAGRFDVELFAENLLDERYATGVSGGSFFAGFFDVAEPVEVGTPRRFGVRAALRF